MVLMPAGPIPSSMSATRADAIEHLRLAIERAERFCALAARDSDFDPIRDNPCFKSWWARQREPSGWSRTLSHLTEHRQRGLGSRERCSCQSKQLVGSECPPRSGLSARER